MALPVASVPPGSAPEPCWDWPSSPSYGRGGVSSPESEEDTLRACDYEQKLGTAAAGEPGTGHRTESCRPAKNKERFLNI